MAGIYVYSDRLDIAAELIGFARQTGKTAAVISLDEEQAKKMAELSADKVYLLKGNSPVTENYSKAVAEFLRNQASDLLAVGATARGRDIAARIAGYLDCGMVSDVSSAEYINGEFITQRMMYGGAVIQSETLKGFGVITVPAGKYEAASPGGTSEIITIDVAVDDRTTLIERTAIVKEGTDLKAADRVVCIGMGMDKAEDVQMAEDLAAVLGADIGCTRGIAEERHWLPVEQYIGISGAEITPRLYLAMGVSGQVQHMFGVRDAKIIAAIDTNEKAPIFKSADYGIVGDMYEIIPLLSQALKNS
jgi:Electron transfer flavoprotein, alpha subunit